MRSYWKNRRPIIAHDGEVLAATRIGEPEALVVANVPADSGVADRLLEIEGAQVLYRRGVSGSPVTGRKGRVQLRMTVPVEALGEVLSAEQGRRE